MDPGSGSWLESYPYNTGINSTDDGPERLPVVSPPGRRIVPLESQATNRVSFRTVLPETWSRSD